MVSWMNLFLEKQCNQIVKHSIPSIMETFILSMQWTLWDERSLNHSLEKYITKNIFHIMKTCGWYVSLEPPILIQNFNYANSIKRVLKKQPLYFHFPCHKVTSTKFWDNFEKGTLTIEIEYRLWWHTFSHSNLVQW